MYKKLRDKVKNNGNLPKHIAIIMDGNGRWAKLKNLPRAAGHHTTEVEIQIQKILSYPIYFL